MYKYGINKWLYSSIALNNLYVYYTIPTTKRRPLTDM